MNRYFAEYALLPGGLARDVTFEIADGRFTAVTAQTIQGGAERLPGVVLPGLANCHSHAFHRALRGRTHHGGGTFWTWRTAMYALAERLDPDRYLALARAVYAEMALAGVTSVGEFHYLHHGRSGRPYDDPNAMAQALRQAAEDAGVRLTLLDACYLAGGLAADGHLLVEGAAERFSDGTVEDWAQRVGALQESPGMRIGVAVHSVRAVPREAIAGVAEAAAVRPLHVHLSEQPAENEMCQAYYGMSPTQLLAEQGALGERTTIVHGNHVDAADIALLGLAPVTACLCPSTERDLADGLAPAGAFARAGLALSVGSDQHAVIDLFEEARGLELHERLATLQRGRFTQPQLLGALTAHASIGWADAGELRVGARADLVAVRLDSVRTAGVDPAQVLMAATASDVATVIRDGAVVVHDGQHRLGAVGGLLGEAVAAVWE